MNRRAFKTSLLVTIALVTTCAAGVAPASGAMEATKIARHLCKVVGGGRFVDIRGFPGEKIDRRLLPDIRWMKRDYDIFITDGLSSDPVHAANGEHPIGLATDIVPDRAAGGTWRKITRLANLAEPTQDHPIMPWRWVGYNGDAGHGRGNHLHLSWSHSPTDPGDPARVVYTRRCPRTADGSGDTTRHRRRTRDGSGGVSAGDAPDGTGGVDAKRGFGAIGLLAPIVPEDY